MPRFRVIAGAVLCLGFALPFFGFAQGRERASVAGKVSFSKDIQSILNDNCVVCHQAGAAPDGLRLDDEVSYSMLVGRKSTQSKLARVQPGAPEASYLLLKLKGTHAAKGGKGGLMPPGGGLDPKAIDRIRFWIASGAKQ